MQIVKIGAGSIVYKVGEPAEDVFFVKDGKMSLLVHEHNGFEFMSIDQGEYIGDLECFYY